MRMKVVVLNPVAGALIRGKYPYTEIQKENKDTEETHAQRYRKRHVITVAET